ncbi:MAG: PHP domain-containing protein, partial [Burkholderiales bacterium]
MSELLPGYAELHCLSAFSFLRGASQPEELVERAQVQGYAALAITDECSLAGAVRAHLAAKDAGLPLVIGSEFTLDDGMKLVLHAVDRDSYGDLAALITRARRRAIKGHYRVTRDDVADLGRRCLALWIPGAAIALDEARSCVDAFGANAAMAAELFARGGERARLADLTAVSRATGL